MPMYDFKCRCCKETAELIVPVGMDTVNCFNCDGVAEKIYSPPTAGDATMIDNERFSDAMGINPDQIKLAMKTFPQSEYTADGGLKIKNRAHKKVEMARRGYVEFE